MVQHVSIAVERKLVRLTKLKLDCAELKLDYEKLKNRLCIKLKLDC